MADQPAGFVQSAPRKSGLRITLEAINVVKTGKDAWKVLMIATVLDNPKPADDLKIQFYLGEDSVESPISVEKGSQRAVRQFSDLPKKKYTFFANIVGTSIWETHVVDIQEPRRNPTLRLEVTEPNKTDGADTWEAVATAIVTETNRPEFVDELEVRFFLEGAPVGVVEASDGNATKKITGIRKGNATFSAEIVGFPGTRKTTSKQIKEDKPKKPAELLYEPVGRNGDLDITFQVLTEDRLPVSGATIQILDGKSTPRVQSLAPTDKNGNTTHRIVFLERRRIITAQVLGSDVRKTINLFNSNR